ncbi:hypothetical protein HDU86_000872 [Geranomyces michiganensis]|nr:hypothetical protein HDU86_000872 [Geranomyces michiganensis]
MSPSRDAAVGSAGVAQQTLVSSEALLVSAGVVQQTSPASAVLQSPPPAGQHSLLPKIALAGLSNMIAACFTNPFDLVKVRQQLSHTTALSATTTRSPSWYTTLVNLVRSEGPRSVYKGLSASLLREGTYSGIRMGGYDACKAVILSVMGTGGMGNGETLSKTSSLPVKLGAGMASGMIGAAIANPADLLKVRMQSPDAAGSLVHHLSTIIRTEGGVKGLYRAVGPTVTRAGILTSSQLGTYDAVKYL